MEFEILDYKAINKGSLVGTFNIVFNPLKLIIRDISLFEKNGEKWVSMPCRSYEADGKKKYFKYVLFQNEEDEGKFKDLCIKKLASFLQGPPQEELPF